MKGLPEHDLVVGRAEPLVVSNVEPLVVSYARAELVECVEPLVKCVLFLYSPNINWYAYYAQKLLII